MAVEQVSLRAVLKPWGSTNLRPWGDLSQDLGPVGEIWYQRDGPNAPESSLQLKMLFTKQKLSIQVHPGDDYAKSLGMAHGKTEAWYILAAEPGAQVAVGLSRRLTPTQLRGAIADGTIATLIQWRDVEVDDVIFVPAGTIHTIGAGLVIAEIQQRSDTTFRLFDYGRARELDVDKAVAIATCGPVAPDAEARQFTNERTLLVVDPHFVLERIELPPATKWSFEAERETWLFVLRGSARIGPFDVAKAGGVFLEKTNERIEAGPSGITALVAYPGLAVARNLLRKSDATAHSRAPDPQSAIKP